MASWLVARYRVLTPLVWDPQVPMDGALGYWAAVKDGFRQPVLDYFSTLPVHRVEGLAAVSGLIPVDLGEIKGYRPVEGLGWGARTYDLRRRFKDTTSLPVRMTKGNPAKGPMKAFQRPLLSYYAPLFYVLVAPQSEKWRDLENLLHCVTALGKKTPHGFGRVLCEDVWPAAMPIDSLLWEGKGFVRSVPLSWWEKAGLTPYHVVRGRIVPPYYESPEAVLGWSPLVLKPEEVEDEELIEKLENWKKHNEEESNDGEAGGKA